MGCAKFLLRLLQSSLIGLLELILFVCPMVAVSKGVIDCATCVHGSLLSLVQSRPKIHDLLCWIDPVATGIMFSLLITTVILLRSVSVLLLIAYSGLVGLAIVLSYRVFLLISAKINGKETDNPLKAYLDSPIVLPSDKVHSQVDSAIENAQKWINNLRRLFLIESIVDSLKLVVVLWALTYIGSWLALSTIVILGIIYAFTVPLIMEKHGKTICKYHDMALKQYRQAVISVDSKAPFMRLRHFLLSEETEKKKE